MSALGRNWRLRGSNTQNQNVTLTVKARYFKYDSGGSVVWSDEVTLINAVSVSATTGTTVSSGVDNSGSAEKWTGMYVTATFQAASATNGTGQVLLTIEMSTDAGTTWPTQDRGIPLGGFTLLAADGTNARAVNFFYE